MGTPTLAKALLACVLLAAASARAEIVVVVNPQNPATRMFSEQAAQFFLGKSNLFTPVDHAKEAPIRKDFYQKVAGKSLAQMEGIWAKAEFSGKGGAPKNYPNAAAVKKAVAGDASAIGYLDRADVDDTVKVILSLP